MFYNYQRTLECDLHKFQIKLSTTYLQILKTINDGHE